MARATDGLQHLYPPPEYRLFQRRIIAMEADDAVPRRGTERERRFGMDGYDVRETRAVERVERLLGEEPARSMAAAILRHEA